MLPSKELNETIDELYHKVERLQRRLLITVLIMIALGFACIILTFVYIGETIELEAKNSKKTSDFEIRQEVKAGMTTPGDFDDFIHGDTTAFDQQFDLETTIYIDGEIQNVEVDHGDYNEIKDLKCSRYKEATQLAENIIALNAPCE